MNHIYYQVTENSLVLILVLVEDTLREPGIIRLSRHSWRS